MMKRMLLVGLMVLSGAAMADNVNVNVNDSSTAIAKATAVAKAGGGAHKPPVAHPKPRAVAVAKSNAKATNQTTVDVSTENSATGGNASAEGGNSTAIAAAGNGGAANTNIVEEAKTIPVSTAYSASLTSGLDTCLGSGSGGLQLVGVGVTGGKTYKDTHCEMVKDVQLLREMRLDSAACYRARAGSEGKAIDDAMKQAGVDCNDYGKPVPIEGVAQLPADVVTHDELLEVEKRIITKTTSK